MHSHRPDGEKQLAGSEPAAVRYRLGVFTFFLLSGATSLTLEVVWTRMLGTVFGNTVLAASTVVTSFMLGLALGSVLLGRWADRCRRPLALYGRLEVGVGLYTFLFPLLTTASGWFYGWFFRACEPGPVLLNGVRFVLSLAMLLPPTILMGGTLPVLGRFLGVRQDEPGREVGYLYGINTFGGVLGCFLAGFVLLEAVGVRGTLFLAGGTAMIVGVFALWLGARTGEEAKPVSPRAAGSLPAARGTPAGQPAGFYLVLAAFGLTGFCALAFQMLWTRILLFLLTTTVYAFAAMLIAFLVGIALGSACSARFIVPRLRRPVLWFGIIEVLVALAGLASVPALARLNLIDAHVSSHFRMGGLTQLLLTYLGDTLVVLFAPTFLMGVAFPIVTTGFLRGEPALGRRLGQIYAANTIGCVLGSVLAGFVLIPALGVHRSLLTVVAINLVVGVVLIGHASGPRDKSGPIGRSWFAPLRWGIPLLALSAAAFVFTPADIFHQTINLFHNSSRIIFLKEHSTATVTVHDLPPRDRLLAVDGVDVAGLDLMLRTTQKLQGYIPLCLHPDPRHVVQIGFGSGETTRVGLELGVEDYTVVEVCPAVFDAGPCFEAVNRGSYRDPRVHKLIMDGKNFALLSGRKFDIVMNDSIFPGSCGSSALYTIDHFRQCRERLAEGGLFSCWVPLDLRPGELRMILRSFQAVFPHTSVWVASNTLNKQGLILGSLAPLQIDFLRLKARLERPAIRADLAAVAIQDVYDFLDCHMCDAAAIRRMVERDPINSDNRPRLEFSCARRIPWQLRLRQTLAMLTAYRSGITPSVVHFEDDARDRGELNRRFESRTHLFRAQVAQLAWLPQIRRQELDLALQLNPDDSQVKSCEAELEGEIQDLQQLYAQTRLPSFAVRLADKLFLALRYEEAAPLYERRLSQRPPPIANVFAHLAEIRFHIGDAREAEHLLRQGLDYWPDSAEIHDLLGGVCWQSGRKDEARWHSAQAVRLDPGNAFFQEHQRRVVGDVQPR
jgi:spermidine synthase